MAIFLAYFVVIIEVTIVSVLFAFSKVYLIPSNKKITRNELTTYYKMIYTSYTKDT